ncbi:MAG: hypothetical protein EXS16_10370 [Gemmataceae bacterium]|nr:hypothetical protein [Gemmataceae bacterium]
MRTIEVQGHRGARGVAVENTLASFEAALDVGVTSIETDVHLTRDGEPVLFHDACIQNPGVLNGRLVRSLTLAELRTLTLPGPRDRPSPTAARFAETRGFGPFDVPTLAHLLDFVNAYAHDNVKTPMQRQWARRVIVDIELKRTPFRPEFVADAFDGTEPAELEHRVIEAISRADMLERSRIRSFDHRSVQSAKRLAPTIGTALLVHNTVPASLEAWLRDAQVDCYCPDFEFVDADVVRRVHAAGVRIITYTVNEVANWSQLVNMGVDGITTDYPQALIDWLR